MFSLRIRLDDKKVLNSGPEFRRLFILGWRFRFTLSKCHLLLNGNIQCISHTLLGGNIRLLDNSQSKECESQWNSKQQMFRVHRWLWPCWSLVHLCCRGCEVVHLIDDAHLMFKTPGEVGSKEKWKNKSQSWCGFVRRASVRLFSYTIDFVLHTVAFMSTSVSGCESSEATEKPSVQKVLLPPEGRTTHDVTIHHRSQEGTYQ